MALSFDPNRIFVGGKQKNISIYSKKKIKELSEGIEKQGGKIIANQSYLFTDNEVAKSKVMRTKDGQSIEGWIIGPSKWLHGNR